MISSVIPDNFDFGIRETDPPKIVTIPMIRKLGFTISRWNKSWQNRDYIDACNIITIKKSDILSVTYSFVCANKGHLVTPYCGLIKLITPEGEEIEEKANGAHLFRIPMNRTAPEDLYFDFKLPF